jgi:hypothetical protein
MLDVECLEGCILVFGIVTIVVASPDATEPIVLHVSFVKSPLGVEEN